MANTIDLSGTSAVITGGARGIGHACAARFLQSGATVTLWDLDADLLRVAAAQLGDGVHVCVADVSDQTSVDDAARETMVTVGKVDILVNNAGITGPNKKTWEYPPADWRRVIEIDLVGPFLCSRALIPGMIERGYGRIINIASVAGKEGNPNASAYSAAKAGLIGLTKSLSKELAISGVLVNCVTPAAAQTELFQQMTQKHVQYMLSKIPMNRFIRVEEIAALVAWLASNECSFSTGAVFDLSGGRATY
jgi:NAD(P)-dependent dehydrogenase (short-subunit alcohol dehydrogenase family)